MDIGKRPFSVFWTPKMGRPILLLLWCAFIASLLAPALKPLALAQQNPGFISIDCGAPNPYPDGNLKIYYETDNGFTDSGENKQIAIEHIYEDYLQISKTLRSFPHGMRNCYTLKPDRGKNSLYLIKASFWYGNYDGKNEVPMFDLYIDVNHWATINSDRYMAEEIMYVSQADYIQVCVVNRRSGIPFISALELRVLNNSIYETGSGFLRKIWRHDMGASPKSYTRYPLDAYDRIWWGYDYYYRLLPSTGASATSLSNNNDAYKVPEKVLMTAATVSNSSLSYSWTPPKPYVPPGNWILYFHFAETQILRSGQQREFTVSINGNQFTKSVTLEYLKPVTVVSTPVTGSQINISISPTSNESTYPPILNAIEVYNIVGLPNVQTAEDDVKAINDTKATYGVNKESWQGDPCIPSNYTWDGLNCSYGKLPRIISLNLSSSNLRGNIHSLLSNLSELKALDLSNNELTGAIPETLANLLKLRILNLSGNKLNGSVPEALKRRVTDKKLDLSFNNNPDLRWASPYPKNKSSILVPAVASVSGVVIVICLVTIWLIRRKQIRDVAAITTTATFGGYTGTLKLSKNRQFSSTEVARITDNFRTVIGEGGFGKVYFGRLDNGTQVAVKMLSRSSKQGYKEFHAEAQLLMVVHHRNLVSLIGYCEEFENMALIYEFMSNGNVRQHLSAHNPNVLSWSQRLQIAVDAAQGLEYLHNGCKPPIIHRDLKTPNILLNENMQAKICDFGLSRAFVREQDSYISTCPAGTPGYLDPEFHILGHSSQKSDIYSFGIVLFELITGHPAIIRSPEGNMHILHWVTPFVERGDIQSIVDPRLNDQFNISSVRKAVEIAMACVPTNAVERADMNRVLSELKECLTVEISSGRSQRMGNSERRSEFDTTTMELDCPPYTR